MRMLTEGVNRTQRRVLATHGSWFLLVQRPEDFLAQGGQ